jgi:hypothetical protein
MTRLPKSLQLIMRYATKASVPMSIFNYLAGCRHLSLRLQNKPPEIRLERVLESTRYPNAPVRTQFHKANAYQLTAESFARYSSRL